MTFDFDAAHSAAHDEVWDALQNNDFIPALYALGTEVPALIAGGLTVDIFNQRVVCVLKHQEMHLKEMPVSLVFQCLKELEEQFFIVPDCQGALQLHNNLGVLLLDSFVHFLYR